MQNLFKKLVPSFVKKRIKKSLNKSEFKKFQKQSNHLTKSDLILGFKRAGIAAGDILFVHSSLKGLGYIENGPRDVIEALQETIGPDGTLILPAFSISGNMLETLSDPDQLFDPKSSPSTVGAITNYFRDLPDVHRSIHPTHSVCAWGKHATHITSEHFDVNSNFGPKTPFGKFLDLNGKVVGLGINYGNVTYYHVYEDFNLEKWPNVYLPNEYEAKVIDHHGNTHTCRVKCHNPEFHSSRIEKKPEIEHFFSDYFANNAISTTTQIGDGSIWWMHSQLLIDHLDKLFKQGISIYKVN